MQQKPDIYKEVHCPQCGWDMGYVGQSTIKGVELWRCLSARQHPHPISHINPDGTVANPPPYPDGQDSKEV